jgi:hypothetical protein
LDDRTFVTSSGVTLNLRPVPPFVMAEAQSILPAPEPPLEETNLGMVPNPGRAEYQREHKKWLAQLDAISFNAALDLGVKRFPIPADALVQLEEYKEILKEPPYKKEVDQTDWVSYLTMILIPDPKNARSWSRPSLNFPTLRLSRWRLSASSFNLTWRGVDLWSIKVPLSRLSADFEFEEGMAAQWAGCLSTFHLLPTSQKAYIIALYQGDRQAKAVEAYYASIEQSSNRSKRRGANRPIR